MRFYSPSGENEFGSFSRERAQELGGKAGELTSIEVLEARLRSLFRNKLHLDEGVFASMTHSCAKISLSESLRMLRPDPILHLGGRLPTARVAHRANWTRQASRGGDSRSLDTRIDIREVLYEWKES